MFDRSKPSRALILLEAFCELVCEMSEKNSIDLASSLKRMAGIGGAGATLRLWILVRSL